MKHLTNWTLAWRTAEFVIDHPEEHDQTWWPGCFAGHAIRLQGQRLSDLVGASEVEPCVTRAACNALGMPHIGAEFWQLFGWDISTYELLTVLKTWAEEDGVAVPDKVLAARAVALAADREAEVMGG